MHTNILWSGIEQNSLENCTVRRTNDGFLIESAIVGQDDNKLFRVEYEIRTDHQWKTLSVRLKYRVNAAEHFLYLNRDDQHNWQATGSTVDALKGCIDVDISVTPFTNTLPINRLNLNVGESEIIRVVYFNLLEETLTSTVQRYERISKNIYHYENVPNDFEADISVDDFGFVTSYLPLFQRNAILQLL